MRYGTEYVELSLEQIKDAQHADIAEYLKERGEKLKHEGNHYIWSKHDSCIITGYMWYQNSTGAKGAAVKFLQHFFGYSFPNAVLELTKGKKYPISPHESAKTGTSSGFTTESKKKVQKKEQLPLDFSLPPSAPDNRRLFAYLSITRGISPDIVTEFLQDRLIYQDINGNVVFVCYDKQGFPRAAHRRGTNTQNRFRGFVTGGDFSCGFSYVCETAKRLYVFEAPIDMMSYISLHRHEPWFKHSYLSLGGLSDDALKHFLKEYPIIETIVFCLDNDMDKTENHGQLQAKKYAAFYGRKRQTCIDTPIRKDWNEVLLAHIRGEIK